MPSPSARVEKATSHLLIEPDWAVNMNICDSVNSDQWQAKYVLKAVKKRLQHKEPKVQLLALTLLEALVKNCGGYVHLLVSEKNILHEMIKIVKKKSNMHVRDKVLVLLDSWKDAFGGPRGKYPQYYWAYVDLKSSGIEFPQGAQGSASMLAPSVACTISEHAIPGNHTRSSITLRIDDPIASKMERLSLSNLNSVRSVAELLNDMIQAVNPNDHEAVKDEVIQDLVHQCRSYQRRLRQLLNTTGDEELLGHGLQLNDGLQSVLEKHDAIVSGIFSQSDTARSAPVVATPTLPSCNQLNEMAEMRPVAGVLTAPISLRTDQVEEDDVGDFVQLARRRSKQRPVTCQNSGGRNKEPAVTYASSSCSTSVLTLPDSPAPVRITKEQDMIELLSMTIQMSNSSSPPAPVTPIAAQAAFCPQDSSVNSSMYENYVVPWARPLPQWPHNSPTYPSSQWVVDSPDHMKRSASPAVLESSQNRAPLAGMTDCRSKLQFSPFGSGGKTPPATYEKIQKGSETLVTRGLSAVNPRPKSTLPVVEQKPFVPSYRLFEELVDLRNADGSAKSSLSGLPRTT